MKVFNKFFLCLLILLAIAQPLAAQEKRSVAVLPFALISSENIDYLRQGILNMIASRLSVNERIEVIARDQVLAALTGGQEKEFSPNELTTLGKQLNADFLVSGSITKIGNSLSIDAKLFQTAAGKETYAAVAQSQGMDEIIPKVNELTQRIDRQITGNQIPAAVSSPQNREIIVSRSPQATAQSEREAGIISGIRSSKRGTLTSMINPDFINAEQPLNPESFWRSVQYPYAIRGMDIGDVNGDGLNETVIIDANTIYIYQRKGESFTLLEQIKGRSFDNYIALDVADINGNGTAEIIVNNYTNGLINSFVIEYKNGRYETIATGLYYFLRVVDTGEDLPVLLGQRLGISTIFENPIYEIVWRNGRYEEGRRMKIPQGLAIFGVTMAKLSPGGSELVIALDTDDYLRIFEPTEKPLSQVITFGGTNELVWRSDDVFGGSNTFIEVKDPHNAMQANQATSRRAAFINVRVLTYDTNKDGKREVIIVKNSGSSAARLFQDFRMFSSAEVFNLEWEGMGMVENWRTKKINGYVSDYQFKDIDNDWEKEVVLSLVMTVGGLERARSMILAYKLTSP